MTFPQDPDIHDLYELCVQDPDALVPLIRAIHGSNPTILGEDFSGTCALSRAWVEHNESNHAVAVDLDASALRKHPDHPRINRLNTDVHACTDPCDALFVGNFSIGYCHTRAELIGYLKHARSRLQHRSGVFMCDTYGGESAFKIGAVHRPTPTPDGRICRYTWHQQSADPLTGLVTDAIHFRLERAGVITHEFNDAFVYHWRLWSVPELNDALLESGFTKVEVYNKLPDALDDEGNAYINPIDDPENQLDDSYIVLVAARTDP